MISRPDNRLKLSSEQGIVSIRNSSLAVGFRKDKTCLLVTDQHNYPILDMDEIFHKVGKTISISNRINKTEMFFGLGEKTGFLDKRGRRYIMWNTDDPLHTPDKDPLYKSIPFMIGFDGEKAYGLFVDSTARLEFDLGYEDRERLTITVEDNQLDLYIINSQSIAEVIQQYTMLTGRMEMPPSGALVFSNADGATIPRRGLWNLLKPSEQGKYPVM